MNPSTAQARVLVDTLARCGVREAVLAPGSRSAPLALALFEDARIRLHIRIDERSAGFLAVGLAKVAGRPVALACTSGTAAANFFPAVLEAAHAHVPLIVLTADRPPELRQTGANQTIDQIKLYGGAVRFFADVGVAMREPGQIAYWRSLASRAYAAAATAPVHINVPFREPLVPDADDTWPDPLLTAPGLAEGHPEPQISIQGAPDPRRFRLKGPFHQMERGAVVVGEGAVDPDAAVALAEASGWPLLSEPTGNARRGSNCVSTYPLLLANAEFSGAHRPDLVITVGKPGLSRSLLGWIRTAKEHIIVDPYDDWADPTRTASRVIPAVPESGEHRPPTAWLRSWRSADMRARVAVDTILDRDGLSEPRIARDLVAAMPDGSLLFVGSSKPIRDVELAAAGRNGIHVIGNRGVSGIDGSISAAIGAALSWQAGDGRGPAYALIGDLAYLHDRNGLLLGETDPRPDVTIVVVDNDGGGIFSLLPQRGIDGFERVFGTSHGVDLGADAAVAGVDVLRPKTPDDLARALTPAPPGTGIRLIYLRTNRQDAAGLHLRLVDAVRHALI
jgi:2-succinyl-5-enolpyruvyl-6-hydroxy-3-cyclohexene-1-carboxylate synthase